MASLFLAKLSGADRGELVRRLHAIQSGKCFICQQVIDLDIHSDEIDIDHVTPTKSGGKDNDSNFAITHASCNRSKQAANLEVARILHMFGRIKDEVKVENRGPNLGDILTRFSQAQHKLKFVLEANKIRYSFSAVDDNAIREAEIYMDELSKFRYFFASFPIQYLAHDERINPRTIGGNISRLVDEFCQKRPQLHVPLAWMSSTGDASSIHVFDGQHKAAAQILLGVRSIPVRVFIDPDPDTLITTNTNAGTSLKQVAFDKSVQRHLGSTLYHDRINRYIKETGRKPDDASFSERDLVMYFRGQSREMKRYILDAVRDGVTGSADNRLRDYIDYGGRGKERPLSYSSIDKTFYSFFIYQEVLDTPISYCLENGENPRELEVNQILRLMNIIAEEIYIGKFDPDIGTDKIENRIQKGESIALDHIRSFRMSKEEILYNWLKYIQQIAKFYYINTGRPIEEAKLFQYVFPEQLWDNIRNFVRNLSLLPLWVNLDLSSTVFGGKQNNSFWQMIFETGKTPQGMQVLPSPINLVSMIK
jgi:hypothetical protein